MGAATGPIFNVAFSPDGLRLVTYGEDENVTFLDAATGQEILTLRRQLVSHPGGVAFSPDGRWLAANSNAGRVKLWDAGLIVPDRLRQRDEALAWHDREARGCEQFGRLAAAVFHLGRLVAEKPEEARLYSRRGWIELRKGEWKRASEDSARSVELGLGAADMDREGWQPLWMRYHFADQQEYGRLCRQLLERNRKATDVRAFQASRFCSLSPDGGDSAECVRLAKKAIEARPNASHYWENLGLAHCRAGDWKDAAAAFARAIELQQPGDLVLERHFLRAVARWHLCAEAKARASYNEGVRWVAANRLRLARDPLSAEEIKRFRIEAEEALRLPPSRPLNSFRKRPR